MRRSKRRSNFQAERSIESLVADGIDAEEIYSIAVNETELNQGAVVRSRRRRLNQVGGLPPSSKEALVKLALENLPKERLQGGARERT